MICWDDNKGQGMEAADTREEAALEDQEEEEHFILHLYPEKLAQQAPPG